MGTEHAAATDGERDRAADERQRIADERERIADERERFADERARFADEREPRLQHPTMRKPLIGPLSGSAAGVHTPIETNAMPTADAMNLKHPKGRQPAWASPEVDGRMVPSRAERESPIRRARLRAWFIGPGRGRLAAVSVLIAVAASIVIGAWPHGSGSGDSSAGSSTEDPMSRLTTGVCFNLSNSEFDVVPCAQPHDNEAYYRAIFPPGPFPGDQAVENGVMSTCDARLGGYVGGRHIAEFFDWPLGPDPSEWAAGIHFTVCALGRIDQQKITGSAHQTG